MEGLGFRVCSDIGYWGYIGIVENKMETTIVCWGYMGIMEKENGNYYLGCRV